MSSIEGELGIETGIYSQGGTMRNNAGAVFAPLALGLIITVFCLPALPGPAQARPKLDCQKMALEYINTLEKADYGTYVRLRGQPYSTEEEAKFKEQLQNPDVKKVIASIFDIIRLFPKIGEIPDWPTEVNLEYEYIQGNDLIEMHGDFLFSEGNWLIKDLEPRGGETLTEESKAQYAAELSPAPPEGRKTIDVGSTELIAKLMLAVQLKLRDAVAETGAHPDDCGLHPSDPPQEREKALKFLSQFPSIGPIPAPAKSLRLTLKGTLDGKAASADVGFGWLNNKLKISFVRFE
jgi:hypothetical protein